MRRTRSLHHWSSRPALPTEPVGSKSFDIDWLDVIDQLAVWRELSPGTRAMLADIRSGDVVSVDDFEAEPDVRRLEDAGLIQVTQDRKRARLTQEAYPFAKFLRALERHDPAARHDKAGMADYIGDHFTAGERVLLGDHMASWIGAEWLAHRTVSIVWLRDFLNSAAQDAQGDSRPANREIDARLARSRAAALTLVQWFKARLDDAREKRQAGRDERTTGRVRQHDHPTPELDSASAFVPLRDLPRLVPDLPADAVARGVAYCVGHLLLFPAFARPGRDVVIGLWPTIARRIAEPEPERPVPFQPEYSYDGAFAVDDMTTLLVAAAASPLRVRKKDGRIYERIRADLIAQLQVLPEWIDTDSFFGDDARIARARVLLVCMDLLRDGAGALRPGRNAAAWLALDATARVRTVLDHVRKDAIDAIASNAIDTVTSNANDAVANSSIDASTTDETDHTSTLGIEAHERETPPDSTDEGAPFDVELFDDYDASLDGDAEDDEDELYDVGVFPLLPGTFVYWSPAKVKRALVLAARRAFAELPADGFTPIGPFLAYEGRAANPLMSGEASSRRATASRFAAAPTDEELEDAWTRVLGDFLADRLIPLGGAALGADSGVAGIQLTSAGRYLLALADDFEIAAAAPPAAGDVIMQPNFEIVFTAPAPRLEAEIGRFAERVGRNVGVLYRVTRDAVFAAAAAGITVEQTLAVLRAASSKAIPDNVEREIEGWFHASRHVPLQPALLLRCPDPETAGRVVAAGGKAVRRLSDTVIELADPSARSRVIRKLRSKGVFVADESQRKQDRKRKKRRRD